MCQTHTPSNGSVLDTHSVEWECASVSLCATVNRSVPAQCLSTQPHSCSVSLSTHTLPAPLNTPPHTDPLLFMHALRIHTDICVRGCVERGTNAATRNYMNAATRNYTLLCVHTLCIHNTHSLPPSTHPPTRIPRSVYTP